MTYVLSKNLHRRHLTTSQRAAVAAETVPLLAEEAKKRQGGKGRFGSVSIDTEPLPAKSRAIAAKAVQVGEASVQRALDVKRADPKLFEQIKKGEVMDVKTKVVDVYAVAAALGCSDRQVQKLVLEGMPRERHGGYNLACCIEWYEARCRKRRRWGVVSRRQRRATMGRVFLRTLRRRLQALPVLIAPQLVGKNEAEIRRLLRLAVRAALGNLIEGSLQGGN